MSSLALRSAVAAAALSLAACGAAFAHATFEPREAKLGAGYKAVLRVPHGCEGQPTHTVRVTIPEGVVGVKPQPKAGWTLTTRTGSYARPHMLYGKPVAEGVTEIVWAGGNLPDDQFDEFAFQAVVADGVEPGETLYVPAVQECPTGKVAWTEIPAKGQDPHALKSPAPGIRLAGDAPAAAEHHNHGSPAAQAQQGTLSISAPWARATPGAAKVGGGYITITNTGKEPDRLVAGETGFAGRVEFHEMATVDGVMRMRPLKDGLTIAPGQTVTLEPGGLHIMFMDLKQPLKEGEKVQGKLTFEKAGTLDVTFEVRGMGAKGHSH